MIKLKNILSEAYAWERQAGKPLPTLKDVQEAYRWAKNQVDAAQIISHFDIGKSVADYFMST